MVEYGKALKKPFEDWQKFLIGVLLNIIPIVNFIVSGYGILIAKSTMRKNHALPPWKNFWELWVKGFFVSLIMLIWGIPLIILAIILIGIISVNVAQVLFGGQNPVIAIVTVLATGGPVAFLILVYALLMAYLIPVGIIRYARSNAFGDAFAVSKITKKAFTAGDFGAWLINAIITLVIMSLLSFIPIIGPIVGAYITMVISMTIFAQAVQEA